MGNQKVAIELLSPSVVAKSEEYAVSGIVRQPNIENFTAACNGGSIRKRSRPQKSPFPRFVISPKKDAVTLKLITSYVGVYIISQHNVCTGAPEQVIRLALLLGLGSSGQDVGSVENFFVGNTTIGRRSPSDETGTPVCSDLNGR